tara:strand:+ start:14790 stop:15704 length:915 start_codon:yes stop_codon:yes gene_type:complete
MSIFKKKIVISLIFVTLFSIGATFYVNKFNKDKYQKELTFEIYDIMSDVHLTIIWKDFGLGSPDLLIKKFSTKLDTIILYSSNPCKKLSMVSNDLPVLIFYKEQQIEIEIQSLNKEYLEKCSEFIQSKIDIFNKKQTDYFLTLASILRMKGNSNKPTANVIETLDPTTKMDQLVKEWNEYKDTIDKINNEEKSLDAKSISKEIFLLQFMSNNYFDNNSTKNITADTESEYTTYMKRQVLDVERIRNVKFLNLSYERDFVLEKPSFLIIFLSIFTVLMGINLYLQGSEGSKKFKKFKANLNKFIS